ncbi:MAG: PAS domain-containing sensor histidine kinase [Pseudomonadota bacterium]
MKSLEDLPHRVAFLRHKAEEKVRKDLPAIDSPRLSPDEAQRLLHELLVHQIELEIQNEELRRAQVELDAARAKYFDLYDLAPVGYLTIGEKGLILEANLTAAALLGTARKALTAQPLSRFIHPEDQDIYYHHRQQLLGTERPQVCELRMARADGPTFHARLDATAVRDVENGERLSRAAFSDITEQKRMEKALRESEQAVRRLNEHILNMVLVLSHDIRGPIVAIASSLKLMLRGAHGQLDQGPAKAAQDILDHVVRLMGTADDYLGKAAVVEGAMEMNRETLDLRRDIVDVVLDELSMLITGRQIIVDNRLGADSAAPLTIKADRTWLKAVYRNLFTNAIKYGGKGCTISLGVEPRDSHYRLNVFNSGPPIAGESLERLFVKFGRVPARAGSVPDGVGLGLCLSRDIIQAHGGEIWYEAQPGGSNFIFTIPRL